jgi:hypothetical protein
MRKLVPPLHFIGYQYRIILIICIHLPPLNPLTFFLWWWIDTHLVAIRYIVVAKQLNLIPPCPYFVGIDTYLWVDHLNNILHCETLFLEIRFVKEVIVLI